MASIKVLLRRWGMALVVSAFFHALVFLVLIFTPFEGNKPHPSIPEVLQVTLSEWSPPPRLEPETIVLPDSEPLPNVRVEPRDRSREVPPARPSIEPAETSDPVIVDQPPEDDPETPASDAAPVRWTALIREAAKETSQQSAYQGIPSHLRMPGEQAIALPGGGEAVIFTDMWPLERGEVEHLGTQDGLERVVSRLPDGTELCGERRLPDPSDSFDISIFTWQPC